MRNAVAVWDFNIRADGLSADEIKAFLFDSSKKWVFQLELGESGYLHYQGRHSLKSRMRSPKKLWTDANPLFSAVNLSPTTDKNRDNDFYVTKLDTRQDGPWQDTDPIPAVFTTQLDIHAKQGLKPWEESLIDIAKQWTMRDINVVIAKGGEGKSLFSEYLEYNKLAYEVPAYNDWKDIARCAYCIANQTCYLIDMPRALNKKMLFGFYAGIETLKNGTVYDDRYSFKKRRMNRPNIIIFTNTLPDFSLLTNDRWKLWTIDGPNLVRTDLLGVPLCADDVLVPSRTDDDGEMFLD